MKTLMKKIVSKIFRGKGDESTIAQRYRMAQSIQVMSEDGMVGIEIWQMDCDCCSWWQYELIPSHLIMKAEQIINRFYENAEGRITISFMKPSQIPDEEPPTRDHALEAYENGHPHVVYI